ncbi:MAG TPA: alpha/beta hydrolase [Solirubrobacteraceae bacterium]|nr:alpha/beta hydrolase [Solirubrobacteraceae bacterium]
MRRSRAIEPVRPVRTGRHDGLAYALWHPAGAEPPAAGVLVLHGAGSRQESHFDFARAAVAAGLAVLTFDQRGHGDSEGALDGRMVVDVVTMAGLLRQALAPGGRIGLRGSSMGGFLALAGARPAGAAAVVAICPASAAGLRRGVDRGAFSFRAEAGPLGELLATIDLAASLDALEIPVLLLHARGDEQVPVEHSRELAPHARAPGSRLIEVPGGHHRSIQHDEELQAVSLRFLSRALAPDEPGRSDG